MHPCHRPSFAFLRHPLSIVVCLALLAGCSTSPLQFPEPLLAKSEKAKATEGVALVSDDGKKAPASLAVPKTEFSGTPTSPRSIVGGVVDRMDKAILDDKKADISLNVEDVQLAAFINEVFGNILGLPFEIESALKEKTDRVTVRLEQPQTAQMVYEVARQVLVNYGVEILHQGDIYRFQIKQVGLSPDEPPILISGEARPSVPIAYRPVFQFVALHSVDPKDVIPWLNSAYEKSGLSVMADGARSGLMLKGMSSIVNQATEAVRLLDQPFMRGRHSLRIDPAFVSAADMASQLKSVIAAQGYSVGIGEAVGSIMLVPLESSMASSSSPTMANFSTWCASGRSRSTGLRWRLPQVSARRRKDCSSTKLAIPVSPNWPSRCGHWYRGSPGRVPTGSPPDCKAALPSDLAVAGAPETMVRHRRWLPCCKPQVPPRWWGRRC